MAAKYFIKTRLTSLSATPLSGALDNIDGVSICASDVSTVITNDIVYNYGLVTATTAEATPMTIKPDYNGTSVRWSLESLFYKAYDNGHVSEPASPLSNRAIIWASNGTGYGDSGDLIIKINVNASIKAITLVNFNYSATQWTLRDDSSVTLRDGDDATTRG